MVVLTGPRQAGKTTLALEVAQKREALYLDLESDSDRAKLSAPELYLEAHLGRLVILDEVHRMPGLFPLLRSLVDRARRRGLRSGLYLLLGSLSPEVSRQAGESLAGRASYLELSPFDLLEVGWEAEPFLWLRGGFPESFLAPGERESFRWRLDFLRSYVEREIPLLGGRLPAEVLRRFLTMLAHLQGERLNVSELARNLGLDGRTVNRYLDFLADLYLLRRLPPLEANVGKRLVKSPKVYLRDSGLVHALLGLKTLEDLLAHPVVGRSYEGFVVENLLRVLPEGGEAFFYRTRAGAEVDLVLLLPGGRIWAVEVKRSLDPRPSRGFHEAMKDLRPQEAFVVYPGKETFPISEGVFAAPLWAVMQRLWAS
ncbi:ATP-binding protein [Thermus sp. FJN-A]